MVLSPRLRQVAAFLVVGSLSAAIDAGVFLLLNSLGMHPVLASCLGFLSAFAVNFTGNRRVVFRARSSRGQLPRYIVLVIVNFCLSAAIVALGIALGLSPVAAKVVSLAIIAVVNFIAMRQWVFRAASEDAAQPRHPSGSDGDGERRDDDDRVGEQRLGE